MAPDGATVWVMSVTGDRRSTADDTVTPLSVASGQPGPCPACTSTPSGG
jgi:hypothetical protein